MAVLHPPRTLLEVFESLPEGTLCQIIENNLVMSPAPTDSHQKILLRISTQLFNHTESNHLGEVRTAPYNVYLDDENVFQPDIIFISKERTDLIRERGLFGAPDLVIEILSPGTEKYDFGNKKNIYEKYGVQEYWLVDPVSKKVFFFRLKNDEFIEEKIRPGTIKSPLLKITISF